MTRSSPAAGVLPGDRSPRATLAAMLRVDHAGEYGARRIYAGQLAALRARRSPAAEAVAHMAAQEAAHLARFEAELRARRVRPSALLPFWHVAGWALGAATAALGDRAAMACTIAVEEVIDGHYRDQLAALGDREPELAAAIESFRAEEVAHRDHAADAGGRETPLWPLLEAGIKAGCRAAIRLAERV